MKPLSTSFDQSGNTPRPVAGVNTAIDQSGMELPTPESIAALPETLHRTGSD